MFHAFHREKLGKACSIEKLEMGTGDDAKSIVPHAWH